VQKNHSWSDDCSIKEPQGKRYSCMPNQGLVNAAHEQLNFEYAIWPILKGTYFRTVAENWPHFEQ